MRARGLRRSEVSTCSIAMIGLAGPQPEDAADVPAAREARVERQRAVDQRHHGADVLAEIGQREGGIRQDARVVAGHLAGPAGRNRCPCRRSASGSSLRAVDEAADDSRPRPRRGRARNADRARSPAPADGAPRGFALPTTRPSHRRADRGRRRSDRRSGGRPNGRSRRPAMPAR